MQNTFYCTQPGEKEKENLLQPSFSSVWGGENPWENRRSPVRVSRETEKPKPGETEKREVTGARRSFSKENARDTEEKIRKQSPSGSHFSPHNATHSRLQHFPVKLKTQWLRLTAPLSVSTSVPPTLASASGSTTGTFHGFLDYFSYAPDRLLFPASSLLPPPRLTFPISHGCSVRAIGTKTASARVVGRNSRSWRAHLARRDSLRVQPGRRRRLSTPSSRLQIRFFSFLFFFHLKRAPTMSPTTRRSLPAHHQS